MINKILVPLDGSAIAEQGLVPACRLARQTGATLILMRAIPFFMATSEHLATERVDVLAAKAYLTTQQERLIADGFSVITEVLPHDAVRAILFAEAAYGVNLISICTHGYTGVRHALLGSVAEAVLRQATSPVLLVRDTSQPASAAIGAFSRLVVPVDGTPLSESAVTYITREGLVRDSLVTLLRVVEPVLPAIYPTISEQAVQQLYADAESDTEQLIRQAKVYLHDVGSRWLPAGQWQMHAQLGYTDDGILHAAEAAAADLMVIATHGRHGVDRLLHGSVVSELIHHTTIPMLILHPGEEKVAGDLKEEPQSAA